MNFHSVYGFIALITSGIFLIQVILSLIGGLDIDLDFDTDVDVDSDIGSGDSLGFELSSLLSPKGALHFLLGSSWYLVLAEYMRGGFIVWYDWLIAICVGLVSAILMGLIYWGMMKLETHIVPENGEVLVGRSGSVYLANKENGIYIVTIVRNGAITELNVKSKTGKEYNTGDIVNIVSFENDTYYIE